MYPLKRDKTCQKIGARRRKTTGISECARDIFQLSSDESHHLHITWANNLLTGLDLRRDRILIVSVRSVAFADKIEFVQERVKFREAGVCRLREKSKIPSFP